MNTLRKSQIRRGFTLIEILVVVVILAVLAAVVVPNVINRIGDAKASAAISDIKAFDTNIDLFKLDTGKYPPTLDDLIKDVSQTSKWNGPYIKNKDKIQNDPWGSAYVYKVPGENGHDYEIVSYGPNSQPGGGDDIESWNLEGS